MSILDDLFAPGRDDKEDARLYAQQMAIYQQAAQRSMMQNQAINTVNMGNQNMAGGGAISGAALGAMQGQYANQWGSMLTPPQIRDKTRNHIANEVEKMAEEIGAPTLLHAVVLAIRTMEIPE